MRVLAACVVLLVLLAGGSTSSAVDNPRLLLDPAWSPDGKSIAFVDNDAGVEGRHGDLYVMNADGTSVRKLTNGTGARYSRGARYPTWSPDSRKLAFSYGYDGIFVINADGTSLHPIGVGCCPDWSRSGRRIAVAKFARLSESSFGRIEVTRPDGEGDRVVASPPDCDSYSAPTWSPDGEQIAFTVSREDEGCSQRSVHLGIIRSYNGRVRALANGAVEADWSPGGRRIAYSTQGGPITVLDLKTGRRTKLHGGGHPSWSPNSRKLVFTSNVAIYVMSDDGSDVTQLFPH